MITSSPNETNFYEQHASGRIQAITMHRNNISNDITKLHDKIQSSLAVSIGFRHGRGRTIMQSHTVDRKLKGDS